MQPSLSPHPFLWRLCLALLPLCSPEYVALMRGTQALGTEELRALSGQYDAIYLHPVRALGTTGDPPTHPCLLAAGDLAEVPVFMDVPVPCVAAAAGTRDCPGPFH